MTVFPAVGTEISRVELPTGVGESFQVFVNGVAQTPGIDFRREGNTLLFDRSLAREGRLGFWRWLSIFLGLVGTYRKNDSVDVQYMHAGRERVATGLDIVPPEGAPGRGAKDAR